MNIVAFLKTLKDGWRGAMMALTPLLLSGLTGTAAWITVIGGCVSAALGFLATAVRSSSVATSEWLKIGNDTLYGILIASQSILQDGLSSGMKITYILGGIGVASLGVFANVLKDDYQPQTAIMKMLKDLLISLSTTLGPILQSGMSAGLGFGVIMAGASHALISVGANTIEHDLWGTAATPDKPAGVQ